MNRAAVIGAGTMGNGIAHVFAQHGWSVALIDTVPAALEKATATIRSNLDRQVKKGSAAAPRRRREVLGRIATATALDAAAGASLVVEAASENPAVKFAVFEQLDRIAGAGGDPRHQHQLDLDHRDRGAHASGRGRSSGCTS